MEYSLSLGSWLWLVAPPIILLIITLFFFVSEKETFK